MEISGLNNINQYSKKPSFRGYDNEWHVFGIDEGGQDKRDYIRKWHEENYIPYQSIYENERRLSEYELNNLLSQFIKPKIILSNEKMMNIGLANLEPLGNTNSAKGAMIKGYELEKLPMLKDAGIRRIVSLMVCPDLEKACKELGMEYLYFDMDSKAPCMENKQSVEQKSRLFWRNIANIKDEEELEIRVKSDINSWEQKSKKSIEKLVEFVKFMQKGNVYIGCACGTYRTDYAVILNKLFNPLADYSYEMYDYLCSTKSVENLYHNITGSDKIKMGWTNAFDKEFLSKLCKIK